MHASIVRRLGPHRAGRFIAFALTAGPATGWAAETAGPAQYPIEEGTAAHEASPGRAAVRESVSDAEQDRLLRVEQLTVARRLTEEWPQNDNAVYLLGLVCQQQGDFDEAIRCWERCIELDSQRADVFDSLGYALLLRGEYGRAAELFRRALAIEPGRYEARFRLADTLLRQGDPQAAIRVLDEERRSGPGTARLLGLAHQQLGDYPAAERHYREALAGQSEMAEAYYGLATVCARMDRPDEARAYREKFRQLKAAGQQEGRDWRRVFNPLSVTRQSVAMTHTDVARVQQSMGNLAEAERLWRRALELDPANVQALRHLALFDQEAGRQAEAVGLLERLCAAEPNDAEHQFLLGSALYRQERTDDAAAAFRRVIELAPDRPEGYRALCHLLLVGERDPAEALRLAQAAARLEPSALHLHLLSQALERNGDLPRALAASEQAAALSPRNAEYRQRYESLRQRLQKKP